MNELIIINIGLWVLFILVGLALGVRPPKGIIKTTCTCGAQILTLNDITDARTLCGACLSLRNKLFAERANRNTTNFLSKGLTGQTGSTGPPSPEPEPEVELGLEPNFRRAAVMEKRRRIALREQEELDG